MPEKIDKIEKDKRIRIVMEWILEDWHSSDIVTNIVTKWQLSERQAKRYIADARTAWSKEEEKSIEKKRRVKIQSLKKLKRSLKDSYKGTPHGIRSILAVEREIIKLEGLNPAQKVEVTGKGGEPIQTESKVKHDGIDYSKLPDDVLMAILKARTVKDNGDDDSED